MFSGVVGQVLVFAVLALVIAWACVPLILVQIRNRLDQIINQNRMVIQNENRGRFRN